MATGDVQEMTSRILWATLARSTPRGCGWHLLVIVQSRSGCTQPVGTVANILMSLQHWRLRRSTSAAACYQVLRVSSMYCIAGKLPTFSARPT